MNIDRPEIVRLTEQYGGQWGINHTRRLLSLVSQIDVGQTYDADAVWVAAHLHDWGAYAPWAQKDVDHALRSAQVAEPFLVERGFPADQMGLILESIRLHHTGDPQKCIEAILLSDADALDFLGVVGVLRDFSKNPKDLRKAYDSACQRRQKVPQMILLEKTKQLASLRLAQMDDLLVRFVQDSDNFF